MLLLSLLLGLWPAQAATLPGPYQPGDTSTWAIEQAGVRLGECSSRYEGEVALGPGRAHRFRDQVRIEVPIPSGKLEQLFTVELTTDDSGHPLSFDFRAQAVDARSAVLGTFANGMAELVVRQGTQERKLTIPLPEGTFLLTNNFVSQLELALVLTPEAPRQFFSSNALQVFPFSMKRAGAEGALVFEDSLGERLHLTKEGRLEKLELPSQQLTMRRVAESVPPVTIELESKASAADIEREEVRIEGDGVSLAGTLTRKKGAHGKLPAVFFLSGSGPQDREGFSSGIDLGTHEILERLTGEGFLVLRVDDRGVGASTGPTQDMDFGDVVEDGRRLARYLFARPDVDPAHVVAIGHSEGGLSAPVLAAEEPLAAIVLMAAPARPLEELLSEQLLFGKKSAGANAAELENFSGELYGFLEAIAKGEPLAPAGVPP